MEATHTGFCEKKTADPLLECVYSTPDLLVYKLMYLTILSNFLQSAPLKKKKIILSPMELLKDYSSEPCFSLANTVTSLGGCWDSYQQTDGQHVGY